MSTYFKNDLNEETSSKSGTFRIFINYINAFNDKLQFFKFERWVIIGILGIIFIIRLIQTAGKQ